jgi:hypothetical protein
MIIEEVRAEELYPATNRARWMKIPGGVTMERVKINRSGAGDGE